MLPPRAIGINLHMERWLDKSFCSARYKDFLFCILFTACSYRDSRDWCFVSMSLGNRPCGLFKLGRPTFICDGIPRGTHLPWIDWM